MCIGLWRAGRGAGWRTVESLAQRLTAQSVAIKLRVRQREATARGRQYELLACANIRQREGCM